ncbi:MAG: hypothetical protein ACKVQW_05055 [Pyrinomonadaceae bacterium]
MNLRVLIITLLIFTGCQSPAQKNSPVYNQIKAERTVFKKSSVEIKSPKTYLKRETKNGKEYDPRPRVVPIDEKAGKYELQWIGYDGKKKIIEYQRHDALDALVEARVERGDDGRNKYKYLIKNLPSSPSFFHSFTVQTFSSDVRDEHIKTGDENLYIGHMAQFIPQFSEGVWRKFAWLAETKPKIHPGSFIEFEMVSSSQPGLVQCIATAGEITLKGVGEHMPSELETALPGFADRATCLTIGPVERLKDLSSADKAKYLIDNLPRFVEAGWMAGDTPNIYHSILKHNDLAGALQQAKRDLEKEFITSEVFHIIEGLNS